MSRETLYFPTVAGVSMFGDAQLISWQDTSRLHLKCAIDCPQMQVEAHIFSAVCSVLTARLQTLEKQAKWRIANQLFAQKKKDAEQALSALMFFAKSMQAGGLAIKDRNDYFEHLLIRFSSFVPFMVPKDQVHASKPIMDTGSIIEQAALHYKKSE